jgi:hypothetical protein
MAKDPFYLLFFFSVHDVRWRPRVIWPVRRRFMVWGEKRCMERVMDSPGGWEPQLVDDGGYHPRDGEGPMSFGVYL